jgi:drug/metabolite transporter (DMT)-like permease
LVVNFYSSGEAAVREHDHALWGVFVIALGALGYAIATVIAKTKLQGLDPIGLATTQLTLAGLMLTPIALLGPHPLHVHLPSVLAIVVLGFAGSGIAYLLYYSLLTHISATQVTAVTYLLPLWGIFWGAVAHESIAPLTYVGVAVVVAGLVLMNRPAAPRAMPAETCVN